jgi:hypothetical protein
VNLADLSEGGHDRRRGQHLKGNGSILGLETIALMPRLSEAHW